MCTNRKSEKPCIIPVAHFKTFKTKLVIGDKYDDGDVISRRRFWKGRRRRESRRRRRWR